MLNSKKRIGINMRVLDYESGGLKEYAYRLVEALLKEDKKNSYTLFFSHARFKGLFSGAQEIIIPCQNRFLFDWFYLPSVLKKLSLDLAFFPTGTMPFGIKCPSVVNVADLGYFHSTEPMYGRLESLYMRTSMRYALKQASQCLAISDFTRLDMIKTLGLRPEKIHTVHLAAHEKFSKKPEPAELEAFSLRFGLKNKKFMLYSGNVSPRKNLKILFQAMSQLKEISDLCLVLTGGRSWGEDLNAEIEKYQLQKQVLQLGHVEDEYMTHLYHLAHALLFPSRFEGFGLPILEAQAANCPVIVANTTSLPEVAGYGALFAPPTDSDIWAKHIKELWKNNDLRTELIKKGQENLKRFSWKKSAKETLAVFNELLEKNKSCHTKSRN